MKTLSTKIVYTSKNFSVEEQEVELASGEKHTYHNIKRLPTVSILPINNAGELYLISQYRPLHGKEIIESVAGYMDQDGESPLDAAKRELLEETGISSDNWQEIKAVDMAGSVIIGKSYIFVAKDLQFGTSNPDKGEENIKLIKVTIEEAVEKVMNGEINTSTSMIGILLLDKLKQQGKL